MHMEFLGCYWLFFAGGLWVKHMYEYKLQRLQSSWNHSLCYCPFLSQVLFDRSSFYKIFGFMSQISCSATVPNIFYLYQMSLLFHQYITHGFLLGWSLCIIFILIILNTITALLQLIQRWLNYFISGVESPNKIFVVLSKKKGGKKIGRGAQEDWFEWNGWNALTRPLMWKLSETRTLCYLLFKEVESKKLGIQSISAVLSECFGIAGRWALV